MGAVDDLLAKGGGGKSSSVDKLLNKSGGRSGGSSVGKLLGKGPYSNGKFDPKALQAAADEKQGPGPGFTPVRFVLDTVSRPQYIIGNLLAGKPLEAAKNLSFIPVGAEKTTVSEALEKRGFKYHGGVLGAIERGGIDILTDPVTYLTLGVGGVAKGTAAGAARASIDDISRQFADDLAKGAVPKGELISRVARDSARVQSIKGALPKSFKIGLNVPFTRIGATAELTGAGKAARAGKAVGRGAKKVPGVTPITRGVSRAAGGVDDLADLFRSTKGADPVVKEATQAARRAAAAEEAAVGRLLLAFNKDLRRAAKQTGLRRSEASEQITRFLDDPTREIPEQLRPVAEQARAIFDEIGALDEPAGIVRGSISDYVTRAVKDPSVIAKLDSPAAQPTAKSLDTPFYVKGRTAETLDEFEAAVKAVGGEAELDVVRLMSIRHKAGLRARVKKGLEEASVEQKGYVIDRPMLLSKAAEVRETVPAGLTPEEAAAYADDLEAFANRPASRVEQLDEASSEVTRIDQELANLRVELGRAVSARAELGATVSSRDAMRRAFKAGQRSGKAQQRGKTAASPKRRKGTFDVQGPSDFSEVANDLGAIENEIAIVRAQLDAALEQRAALGSVPTDEKALRRAFRQGRKSGRAAEAGRRASGPKGRSALDPQGHRVVPGSTKDGVSAGKASALGREAGAAGEFQGLIYRRRAIAKVDEQIASLRSRLKGLEDEYKEVASSTTTTADGVSASRASALGSEAAAAGRFQELAYRQAATADANKRIAGLRDQIRKLEKARERAVAQVERNTPSGALEAAVLRNEEFAAGLKSLDNLSPAQLREARQTWQSIESAYFNQIVVDPQTAMDLQKAYESIGLATQTPQELRRLQRYLTTLTSRWKALALLSLGYHIRNMLDDGFRAFIGGLRNPADFVAASRVVAARYTDDLSGPATTKLAKMGAKQGITAGGRKYTADEFNDLLDSLGVTGSGFAGFEVGELGVRGAVNSPGKGRLATASRRFGQFREDATRAALFKARLDAGDDIFEAARAVRNHLFDYGEVSAAVERARRFWLPFVTFTSKAIPYTAKTFASRPGIPAAMAVGMRESNRAASGNPDNPTVPSYLGSAFAIPVPGGVKDKLGLSQNDELVVSPNRFMAFGALDLLDPRWKSIQSGPGGMITPFVKAPTEVVTNYSLFKGRQYFPNEKVVAPSYLAPLEGTPVGGLLGMGAKARTVFNEDGSQSKTEVLGYSPRASALFSMLPAWWQAAQVAGTEGGNTQFGQIRYFTGAPVSTYDRAQSAYYAEKYGK